jgi:sigma-B regulation protein RsbQ
MQGTGGLITGAGQELVVLSHGFGTDQSAWSAIRPWLESHYRVLSFDLAGAGENGQSTFDFRRHATLFGFADDLVGLLHDNEIESCIYIGHSFSGMIGAAAAVAQPELFARLVMIGASPCYLNETVYRGGFDQSDLDGLFDSMATNFQAWGAGFAPAVVGVADNDAIHEFCRTLFLIRPDIALATCRTIFQSDMRQIATRLRRKTHLLQTARDFAVPREVAAWLHGHIDHSTLDLLDADGHLPHMTASSEIIRVLERRLLHSDPAD